MHWQWSGPRNDAVVETHIHIENISACCCLFVYLHSHSNRCNDDVRVFCVYERTLTQSFAFSVSIYAFHVRPRLCDRNGLCCVLHSNSYRLWVLCSWASIYIWVSMLTIISDATSVNLTLALVVAVVVVSLFSWVTLTRWFFVPRSMLRCKRTTKNAYSHTLSHSQHTLAMTQTLYTSILAADCFCLWTSVEPSL